MTRDASHWRLEIASHEASLAEARRAAAAGELSADELAAIETREDGALRRARAALEAFGPGPTTPEEAPVVIASAGSAPPAARHATPWHDEIALREASLADARREAAAGELSADELAAIEERETRALTRARAALEAFSLATPATAPAPRRRRRGLLLTAVLCFAFVLVSLMVAALTFRQPGTSGTGSVSLDRSQRIAQLLSEAQADTFIRDDAAAIAAYQQVLALDPSNVTALAEAGWLEFTAGSKAADPVVVAQGQAYLHRAVSRWPTSAVARLYFWIAAALTPGNRALAVREYRVFLTLHPSATEVAIAGRYVGLLHLPG